ncbi:MAG: response regulator transcription factor [Myxococcota bacterium]
MLVFVATVDVQGEEPQGVVAALRELGCDLVICGFDLEEIDEAALQKSRPNLVIVEAADRMTTGVVCLGSLRALPPLAEVPALLAVTTSKLGMLDFSVFDDFVLVPVVPAELYARIRQLDWRTSSFAQEERLKIGDLVIDAAGYEAHLGARRLSLTHQEFELLKFLAQHRGKVFTREQLLSRVWGYNYYGGSRTVDIHVRRLRAKLGAAANLVETVRNVGYKLGVTGEPVGVAAPAREAASRLPQPVRRDVRAASAREAGRAGARAPRARSR